MQWSCGDLRQKIIDISASQRNCSVVCHPYKHYIALPNCTNCSYCDITALQCCNILIWNSVSCIELQQKAINRIYLHCNATWRYSLIAFNERVTFWLQCVRSLPRACAYVSVGVSPGSWVRQWVRVHTARVQVRVHQVRVRVHQAWVRVHWTRVRVRVHWTRVRVRVQWVRVRESNRSQSESGLSLDSWVQQ